jgi:hypothetical protein
LRVRGQTMAVARAWLPMLAAIIGPG